MDYSDKIPQEVKTHLLKIDAEVALPNTCALAGGVMRDYIYDTTPRDIDVVLAGPDWHDPSEIEDFIYRLQAREVGKVVSIHHQYTHDLADERLICVVKMDLPEQVGAGFPTVDLLFYDTDKWDSAVEMFDFNLNQYVGWYDEDFKFHAEYLGDSPGILTRIDRERKGCAPRASRRCKTRPNNLAGQSRRVYE